MDGPDLLQYCREVSHNPNFVDMNRAVFQIEFSMGISPCMYCFLTIEEAKFGHPDTPQYFPPIDRLVLSNLYNKSERSKDLNFTNMDKSSISH